MESESKKENHSGRSDKEYFKEILSYIEKTDLEYVQFEQDGKKFSFRRSGSVIPVQKEVRVPELGTEEPRPKAHEFFSIRSPIVGRFHSSMGPDRPALVVEGGRVTAGQKVAIVEAMKIKKEVFSAVTGRVVRIFVRDGDAVEYGQELFQVEEERG